MWHDLQCKKYAGIMSEICVVFDNIVAVILTMWKLKMSNFVKKTKKKTNALRMHDVAY